MTRQPPTLSRYPLLPCSLVRLLFRPEGSAATSLTFATIRFCQLTGSFAIALSNDLVVTIRYICQTLLPVTIQVDPMLLPLETIISVFFESLRRHNFHVPHPPSTSEIGRAHV